MIRINDDWVILIDPYNYILARDLHKKDKHGNDTFKNEGYYSGASEALTALVDKMVKDELKMPVYTLNEAVSAIRKVYTDLVEAIKGEIPAKIVYEGSENE